MTPEQIRAGAYYQGADGSVRGVSSVLSPTLWYVEILPTIGSCLYCRLRTFAKWAVREVQPVWEAVENREEDRTDGHA